MIKTNFQIIKRPFPTITICGHRMDLAEYNINHNYVALKIDIVAVIINMSTMAIDSLCSPNQM